MVGFYPFQSENSKGNINRNARNPKTGRVREGIGNQGSRTRIPAYFFFFMKPPRNPPGFFAPAAASAPAPA
jgi:hypothetical protein